MTAISDFFPRVIPYLVGCSEPLAQQALLDSAISFCESTNVLREQLDAFSTAAGVTTYDLDAPSQNVEIARIISVKVNGEYIAPVMAEDVPNDDLNRTKPMGYYTSREGSRLVIVFAQIPDKAYTVKVTVSIKPTRTTTQLPSELFATWPDAVIAGAITKLALVPNQPFTNPTLSAINAVEVAKHTSKARTEGMYGRLQGSTRVRQRPFA